MGLLYIKFSTDNSRATTLPVISHVAVTTVYVTPIVIAMLFGHDTKYALQIIRPPLPRSRTAPLNL
jgi:hypothetical protein